MSKLSDPMASLPVTARSKALSALANAAPNTATAPLSAGERALQSEHKTEQPHKPWTAGQTYFAEIEIDRLDDSSFQPRLHYSTEAIESLADAIADKRYDPLIVRKTAHHRYEILSGHRRKRAGQFLGLSTMMCQVIEADETHSCMKVLSANENRIDVSDLERGHGYSKALPLFDNQQKLLAQALGISKSLVSQRIKLLSLPQPLLDILREGPHVINYRTGNEINSILEAHPELIDDAVAGMIKVISGDWATQILINQLRQTLSRSTPNQAGSSAPSRHIIKDHLNREVASMSVQKTGILIKPEKGIDMGKLYEAINQAISSGSYNLDAMKQSAD